MIVVLAGGTGAAKFLNGLVQVVDREDIYVIGNTGDDAVFFGLHVSPDLDTICYTLANEVNHGTGWGLSNETWNAMATVERYGGDTWFHLGDRDLGTHLYRTARLREGATLSLVTQEIAEAWRIGIDLVPMTDSPVRTYLELLDGTEVAFQDYFVKLRHSVPVTAVSFRGASKAVPTEGILEAIGEAEQILIAPSNPIVSIGPILAIQGIRELLEKNRDKVKAISPIVAGLALKGPADRLLRELGYESSVVGVAGLLADVADKLVIDEQDMALAKSISEMDIKPVVTNTIMSTPELAKNLASVVIDC
ncbi:MAG: 2-phospho-L-lactate transferase [Firmicutes bacterium]|nr:2-phospho-L-lactate transferase [Bacillota bacterium]